MERLKDLVTNNEGWLLQRIIKLAQNQGYTQYSSTLEEAWRIMVRGLSEPLISFLDGNGSLADVVSAFALKEAHLHQKRGVSQSAFIGLLKSCRQGYRDLVCKSSVHGDNQLQGLWAVEKYFDYLEVKILTEMTETDRDSLMYEMQNQNRELTNEKNRFLTIFESVPNPVMYLNQANQLCWMNQAARELVGGTGQATLTYYAPEDYVGVPEWLFSTITEFQSAGNASAKYQMTLDTVAGHRYVEIKMSRMADVSGKFTGTIAILSDLTDYQQARNQLQAAYSQLRQLFRSVPDGLVVISPDLTISHVNDKLANWIGVSPPDLVGRKCYELLKALECQTSECTLKLVASGASVVDREMEITGIDGVRRHTIVTSAPLYDADGTFIGIVESIKDITERKRAEEGLKNYRLLLQQAQDIILFIRMDGEILEANQAACTEYGYSREELLSLNIKDLRGPGTVELHRQQMQQAYETGIMIETIHLRKDGSTIPVEVSSRRVMVEGETALLSIVRNISERKQAQDEIKYLSFHDKLTGLYNRAYLEKQLSGNLHNEVPCSIIMGDLNGLKVANDAFGHNAGDQLLIEMTNLLQKACRADDIVARIGGDEFVIVLPGADEAAARSVIERIKEICQKSILQPIQPSISLGLATKTTFEQDIFNVLQEAETRMYRRKMLEADSIRSFSIQSLQWTLHEKSSETEEHTERLRTLIRQLAQEMELSSVSQDDLDLLAALHDIGKIAIPDEILNKPGKLTDEEWEIMKRHTEIGYRIAKTSPELAAIAEYILAHHEHWDGQGYPRGLAGEQIPLAARILAVVDAYDVMVNERPYKRAFTSEMAIRELKRNSGTQFDPAVVSAFLALLEEDDSVGA